jgi:hypothetical protein
MTNPEPVVATSISAFFPAFNDAENLSSLVPRIVDTLQALTCDFEISG